MEVRKLTEADAEAFWALRLRALRDSPEAFSSSYEESVETPLADVVERLRNVSAVGDNFILGAFEETLVGMVGFRRDEGIKNRHKGMIWGMYVIPEMRGKGLGKDLMLQAIASIRAVPKLEQLHLAVVTTQKAARQLYLSLGFQVYGLQPKALKLGDKYLDEELMILWL